MQQPAESGPTLPRVRRHGKRALRLLKRARPFTLMDARGDWHVDREGWASREGAETVPARSLLASKASCPRCGRKLTGPLPQCFHGKPLR